MPSARLAEEARAFFDHFEAQGWLTGSGVPISRWQAKASAWLRRASEPVTRPARDSRRAPACDFSAYSAVGEVVANG